MKPNRLLFIFILFLLGYKSQAQAILARSIIGSTGASVQTGNTLIQYTVGEVAILTLQTQGLLLTQGFHQPEAAVSLPDVLVVKDMIVYPNPATTRTKVEFDLLADSKVIITLIDNAGRTVYSSTINMMVGKVAFTIPLSGLASGIYHVVVYANYKTVSEKLIIQ